jgi:nucleoporin POM152
MKADIKIRLSGKAPFVLGLAVRKPASSVVKTYEIDVAGKEWALDLPQHVMDVVGRHEIAITSLRDQSGCDWAVGDGDVLVGAVEVVESARIVAVNAVEDLCVGDTLDFLLQGKAPWTIE